MDNAPSLSNPSQDLRLATLGVERCAVLPNDSVEAPIKLNPRMVAIFVDEEVENLEFSFGKRIAHRYAVEVLGYGIPSSFVSSGMNEGNVVLCGPNLTREIYIRVHDRLLVLLNYGPDFHAGKDSAKSARNL
jgi:hypothetical protein